jgi:hypothetical protein
MSRHDIARTQPATAIDAPELDYTRAHLEHAARTRGLVNADPANELRQTREIPAYRDHEET